MLLCFIFVLISGMKLAVLQPTDNECPECDSNVYRPVCSRGKAYYSICKLIREMCLQQFAETYIYYGECKISNPHPNTSKTPKGKLGKLYSLLKMLLENVNI